MMTGYWQRASVCAEIREKSKQNLVREKKTKNEKLFFFPLPPSFFNYLNLLGFQVILDI